MLFRSETVRTEFWDAGTDIELNLPDGGEFLVLSGSFVEGDDELVEGAWLRMARGCILHAKAGKNGAWVWMKLHNIPHARLPAV